MVGSLKAQDLAHRDELIGGGGKAAARREEERDHKKKAAEYGVKLAQQGHSEDYIREKMYAYIANVEKLDRLAEDGD